MPGALDRLAETAERLIDEYGSSASVIVKKSGGGYDEETRRNKPEETEEIATICTPPQVDKTLSDGNTGKIFMTTFISPENITDPKLLQTFKHKTLTYKITECNPIYSGERIAVFELIMSG